jgi:hypothetical protein
MVKLGDLVKHFKNKCNYQEKFEIKKLKLKENNISVNELLEMDININKKLKKFNEV